MSSDNERLPRGVVSGFRRRGRVWTPKTNIAAVLLVAVLASVSLVMIAENAGTADADTYDGVTGLYYTVLSSKATITGWDGTGALTIPDKLGGNTVSTIKFNAFKDKNLTSVTFNTSSLATIGSSAFRNTNLTSIDIPSTVTTIGNNAFDGCTELTRVTFSNASNSGFTSIGNYLFRNTALEEVDIPVNITSIGDGAFDGCTELKKVTFSNASKSGFTSISKYLFRNTALKKIDIPVNITTIGDGAFEKCENFYYDADGKKIPESTSLTINATNLQTIGASAFRYSTITDIAIPNTVTSVGEYAFDMSFLETVTLSNHNSFTEIGKSVFRSTNIENITIPDNIKTIEDSAFNGCAYLETVNINASSSLMTKIGSSAFEGCGSLTAFTIPNALTTIGSCAFMFVGSGFTISEVNNSTFDVEENIIYKAEKATIVAGFASSLSIPNTVTKIEPSAFAGLDNLRTVRIPASVTTIDGNPFHSCDHDILFEVDPNNNYFKADGNALYSKDGTKLIAVCSKSYVFPAGVNNVMNSAFRGLNIDTITIPSGVTSIDTDSFRNTKLTDVYLPDSVNTLSNYVFTDCYELKTIRLPNITNIGDGTFRNTALTHITIPASVTSIGEKVFQECYDLKWVTFGDINKINFNSKNDAFNRCTLERVTLNGMKSTELKDDVKKWEFYGASVQCFIFNTAESFNASSMASAPDCYLGVRGSGIAGMVDSSGTSLTIDTASGTFYTEDGEGWKMETNVAPVPSVSALFGYDGSNHTAVAGGTGFAVTDGSAADAGNYTAVASRSIGYPIWADGLFSNKKYDWRISHANYDMSSARWSGGPFTYDGTAKSVTISGLPSGVSIVSYSDAVKTDAGSYMADVALSGDRNYNTPYVQAYRWEILKSPAPAKPDAAFFSISNMIYGEFPKVTGNVLSDPGYREWNVKLSYYYDFGCTKPIGDISKVPPGTYWVVGTVDGLTNFDRVVSSPAEFVVPGGDPGNLPEGTSYAFLLAAVLVAMVCAAIYAVRRHGVNR